MSTVYVPYTPTGAGSNVTVTSSAGAGQTLTMANGAGTSATWVNPIASGLHIEEGRDLTIGDRSLLTFMNQVEERLGILRPNEGLESRWDQLKELRRQYQELEKDLLEKEKIMDILKDTHER
jgi:hypothetical protein